MKHKSKVMMAALCFILIINSASARVQASNLNQADAGDSDKTQQIETTENTESKENDTSGKKSEVQWPEGPSVTAGSAIVMEVETGLILYEKNMKDKHYPASITKILTSLVAIENCPLSDTVTFSKDAVFNIDPGSSRCGIDWGEELSLEDCLYGIMLESGNEAAYAVAEHVGGSFDKFVDMMNTKAKELGCVNSHFANPHGLSEDDHYTCAYDMALIASAAIKNTSFAKITGTRTHSVAPTNKQTETRYWANHHKFVKKTLKYDDCIGGKTGWTSKSKYTLVTYARRNGMTLVCVIMDEADPNAQYTETAKLLDFGYDNFSITHVCESNQNELLEDQAFFNKYNNVLSGESPLLNVSENTYVILPNGVKLEDATKKVVFNEAGSIKKTDQKAVIGSIQYQYNDRIIGKGDVLLNLCESELPTGMTSMIETTTTENTKKPEQVKNDATTDSKNETVNGEEKKNLKPYIVAIIIGSIAIIAVVYYFTVERPRIRRRKAYLERRKNHRYRK